MQSSGFDTTDAEDLELKGDRIGSFAQALLVGVFYIFIGFLIQHIAYLWPSWYNSKDYRKKGKKHRLNKQFRKWISKEYKQILIYLPIKYIGNILYYFILPLEYFQLLSTSLLLFDANVFSSHSSSNTFFYENLITALFGKIVLLMLAGIFSCIMFLSHNRSNNQLIKRSGNYQIYQSLEHYRQCLLHDHPLAKWAIFGIFVTSSYDVAIGVPLAQVKFWSIF